MHYIVIVYTRNYTVSTSCEGIVANITGFMKSMLPVLWKIAVL